MLLRDKTAIITGSARGIGKAIAEYFSREGSDLVMSDIDLNEVIKSAGEISLNTGRKCIPVKADVSIKEDIESMVLKTVEEFGKIDILVNNAGILLTRLVVETTEEQWDKVIDTDLKGVFLCSQAVAREMIKNNSGKIITISSCAAKTAVSHHGAYSAAKAGVLGFNRVLALELGEYGINCNAILPGATDTEMTRGSYLTSKEIEKEWIDKTALKRLGKPEDTAKVALFLASDLSSHITGEGLVVSAGEMMSQ